MRAQSHASNARARTLRHRFGRFLTNSGQNKRKKGRLSSNRKAEYFMSVKKNFPPTKLAPSEWKTAGRIFSSPLHPRESAPDGRQQGTSCPPSSTGRDFFFLLPAVEISTLFSHSLLSSPFPFIPLFPAKPTAKAR